MTFVVMELCRGGELFNMVIDQGRLEPPAAQKYFCQMASAIKYAHGVGIAHRDIKLENILLDGSLQNAKVADFGLSVDMDLNSSNSSGVRDDPCGSTRYAAPELFTIVPNKGYDPLKADVWSLGVCLFAMMTGEMPFSVATVKSSEAFRNWIADGVLPTQELFPPVALNVVKALLTVDPAARCDMTTLMEMPWMREGFLRFMPQEVKPSADTSSFSEDCDASSRSETHSATTMGASMVSIAAPVTPPSPKKRVLTEEWVGRAEAWEVSQEETDAPKHDEDDLPLPPKVRRIGWALRIAKSSVQEVIKGVFEDMALPVEVDPTGKRIQAGERGELTVGISTDASGDTQVEWARTGADCSTLKKVYTAVQQALDKQFGKSVVRHRYGKEMIELSALTLSNNHQRAAAVEGVKIAEEVAEAAETRDKAAEESMHMTAAVVV